MSLAAALDALDGAAIARDVSRLVRERSITGSERGAAARVVELAQALGLSATLDVHDLAALRADPDHPGEEVPRTECVSTSVTLPGSDPQAPRLCLNGHLDVVPEGSERWTRDPWAGEIEGDIVHGRGSVDMKGGVVAALHALGAARGAGTPLPAELTFEGRLGVPVGESLADARAGLERAVAAATDDAGPPVQITWSGGQFGSGETDVDDPWVGVVRAAASAELGSGPPLVGVGYGTDMRLYRDHGIPCVMFGPSGFQLAHAVDEHVSVSELVTVARVIVRSAVAFAETHPG